jgi:hypothetical protein
MLLRFREDDLDDTTGLVALLQASPRGGGRG